MKFVVKKSAIEAFNFLDAETIEKARKGEQAANHKYIYRKATGNPDRPYEYIFIEDLISRPMKMIIDFFGVKENQIENVYKKLDINTNYGATIKDLQQHFLEYFCHRDIWDKRFNDKTIRDRNKTPVKMAAAKKINDKTTETPKPESMQQSLFGDLDESEKENWKANPTLMRKIWGIYSGKDIVRLEENENKVVEKVENAEPEKDDKREIRETIIRQIKEFKNFGYSKDKTKNAFENDPMLKNTTYFAENMDIVSEEINNIYGDEKSPMEDFKNESATNSFLNTANADNKPHSMYEMEYWIKEPLDKLKFVKEQYENKPKLNEINKKILAAVNSAISYLSIPDENTENNEIFTPEEKKELYEDSLWRAKMSIDVGKKLSDKERHEKLKILVISGITGKLKGPKYNFSDEVAEFYAKQIYEDITKEKEVKSEAEIHQARSEAMRGNQNAKKYGLTGAELDNLGYLFSQHGYVKGKLNEKSFYEALGLSVSAGNKTQKKIMQTVAKEKGLKGAKAYLSVPFADVKNAINSIYNEWLIAYKGDNNNGSNQNNIGSGTISRSDKDIRNTGRTNSDENVSGSENGSNGAELQDNTLQSGIGSEITEGIDYEYFRRFGDGSGKLTETQALKIREACRKILDSKTDEQMTDADKAVLSLYVGAGGIKKEKNKSNKAILTEFYTPRKIVNKIWQLVDKYLPQQDKTCIEPSSGIGRFAEGRKEKFTMFEYEPVSARIAKILHPESEVVQGEFEKNWIPGGRFRNNNFDKFDCCVGNPPYMEHTGTYKGMGEGKEFSRAEGYFIDRSLKTLKENGILAMVVPSGMLNSSGKDGTYGSDMLQIAKNCELLEAWRLPANSFDSTAIGTDIIVLRKKTGGSNPQDFINGNYFKKNPTHVCGDVVKEKNQWGDLVDVVRPHNGDNTDNAIDLVNINDIEAVIKELPKAETTIVDNTERNQKISNALKGNKNAAGKHHYVESTGRNLSAAEFNKKYGKEFDEKDIEIWKNTDWNGNIDITKLTPEQKTYIEKSENYVKEGDNYINVVNYASGNLKSKLKDLENQKENGTITDKDYEFKKSILNAALPPQKQLGQFNLSPIADWTIKYKTKDGHSLINGFIDWAFNGKVNKDNELPLDSPVTPEEIPPDCTFEDILAYINKIPLRASIKDGENKADRKRVQFRRAEGRRETAEKLFNRYLQEGLSVDDQKDLVENWNTNFNAFVNPDYTKIPVFIDGMNEKMGNMDFTLTPQQIKGITFLTNKGDGLLAYDVGVGKTVTGICATVNQIQTGRAKRPLICVPNAVYENWYAEIKQHFPNIKINELKNLGSGYMPAKDWKPEEGTLTLCTYEALEKMTFHENTLNEIHEDVEFAQLQTSGDKPKSERKLAQESEKINELVGSMAKTSDEFAYFDDMGFDHITVDECFPYNTKVLTEKGWCKIGELIENKVDRVYSYNCVTKEIELKRITAFMPKKLNHKMLKLNLSNGGYLVCTHNHKIYVEGEGYVKAENTIGKNLSVLSKEILRGIQGKKQKVLFSKLFSSKSYKGNAEKNMSNMWQRISIQKFWRKGKFKEIILFKSLCSDIQKSESDNKGKYKKTRTCNGGRFKREKNAGEIYQNENKQSYERSNNQTESVKFKQGETNKKSWWKWTGNGNTGNTIETLTGINSRISNKNSRSKEQNGKNTSCLQTGSSLSKYKISNRIRWILSQFIKGKIFRSEKRKLFEFVRVESIEILESGSFAEYGFRSSEDQTVYDITVEDNHNFIAEGILVSNCHNFKNIFTTPSKLEGIETEEGKKAESNEFRGLSGSKSDRGEKLFAISQYIQRHNNNRNVFGLSATPFQNSPIEIYNILSLFARQRLKELGIYSLQEFVKQFALLKSEYAITATEIKEKMVMKSFNNLSALQNLISEYIDKVDGGEAHVIRPEKRTHLPRLEMTETQKQIMQAEAAYIEMQSKLPKDQRDPGSTLNSLNAMRMATLAPGLVSDERYAMYQSLGFNIKKPSDKDFVETSPKLKFVCESVIKAYKNNNQHGQVIYMPRGVTKFPLVTDYLVKHGVPKDAIIEFTGGDSGSEKKSVEREDKIHEFNDVNGKAKIIIGSENIKEGVNLNGNSTVLYNTMLGWNPTETTQVEGRIWRQGNKQGITHIVYPLLNDSIDPMMYQKYDEKKSRIDNLFSFKGDQMNVEEIDPEELKFGLIKDPLKRADLRSRQEKEQAEGDQRLYAQMIDVLHKQIKVAYGDTENTIEYKTLQTKLKGMTDTLDKIQEQKEKVLTKLQVAEAANDTKGASMLKRQIEGYQVFIDTQKRLVDKTKKDMKKILDTKKSVTAYLAKRGIHTQDQAEKKIMEYTNLMDQARGRAENAEKLKDQYYKEAVAENEKNKYLLPTMAEAIASNVNDIINDLHPMDEEFKAKLKAENEKLHPVKKGLFYIENGRIFMKRIVQKSVVETVIL